MYPKAALARWQEDSVNNSFTKSISSFIILRYEATRLGAA
jgi:hypothetical protein